MNNTPQPNPSDKPTVRFAYFSKSDGRATYMKDSYGDSMLLQIKSELIILGGEELRTLQKFLNDVLK